MDWGGFAQVISAIGVIVVGVLGLWLKRDTSKIKTEATQTNDAVNHVHEGSPRLFDLVNETHSLSHRNKADIDAVVEMTAETAVSLDGVRGCIDDLRDGQEEGHRKLDGHIVRLDQHIAATEEMKTILDNRLEEVRAREQDGVSG